MKRPVPADRLAALPEIARGLATAELAERALRYGRNDIIEAPRGGWRVLVLDTLRDPMLWFLAGTSALFALSGERGEAVILLAASVPLLGMDAFLHRRTQATTEGLASRLAGHASVVRDGATQRIPAADLVPGDVVVVSTGEPFPADCLIVTGSSLQVDESALTGEAYPVPKQPITLLPATLDTAVDAAHWGFAGTRLLTGKATLRVVFTGPETHYGEIVRSARSSSHARTPLQSAVASLVAVLLVASALVCLVLAWIRVRQGYGLIDGLLSAATLAVAALPEEFPVVFTFFLGLGVYRLARQQALVRRAVVVENIGRVSCICSDKTGTLTEGRLRLAHLEPGPGDTADRLRMLACFASRQESGDPLDLALLEGVVPPATHALVTFPFTEDRRRETAVVRADEGVIVASKGAPETILRLSNLDEAERSAWQRRVADLSSAGHKVIAVAWRPLDESTWPGGEPDRDFHFAGLVAFEDPVRPGVADAVRDCRRAGIRVIMVTGDHPETARAVAREIGLGNGAPRIVEGSALAEHALEPLTDLLREADVVARSVPADKVSVVQALQATGEIVAVTGDGVNDVPALQAADRHCHGRTRHQERPRDRLDRPAGR